LNNKRCYSVKKVQEILEVSRPAVYDLLKRNEFRWVVVAGKYRISKAGFDAWLEGSDPDEEVKTEIEEHRISAPVSYIGTVI